MSIAHLKKQAKNLHRLLPEYIAQHPDGGRLSDSQELTAAIHGYPSFHAATTRNQTASSDLVLTNAASAQAVEVGPKPLATGVVGYESLSTGWLYRARYWLADMGWDRVTEQPMVALVFDPLDPTGSGDHDFNILLTDDGLREGLVKRLVHDLRDDAIRPPELFLLVVRDNAPQPWALAFAVASIADFDGRVRMRSPQLVPILDQLTANGSLTAYQRHLLRAAFWQCPRPESVQPAGGPGLLNALRSAFKVAPNHKPSDRNLELVVPPEDEFVAVIAWCRNSWRWVKEAGEMGLEIDIVYDTRLSQIMWDMERFEIEIEAFHVACLVEPIRPWIDRYGFDTRRCARPVAK